MLKKRDLTEAPALYELMIHPEVYPYVRQKAESLDEYYFQTKQTIELEEQGELISRTILDDFEQPIGTISLFDIQGTAGFLGTWIGQPYFGKGFSKSSKENFFDELFYETDIDTVFLKIRKENIRSRKSTVKLPYASDANESYRDVYEQINAEADIFDLFVVEKQRYLACKNFAEIQTIQSEEGIVS